MKWPTGLHALNDTRVDSLLARVACALSETVRLPPRSLVDQVSVAAVARLLALPSIEYDIDSAASSLSADPEQLLISYLIEDAFGLPPREGIAATTAPSPQGGPRRRINWSTANEWNVQAQSHFRSGICAQEVVAIMLDMYEPKQSLRSLSRSRALEDVAVWAHLLPLEVHGVQIFSRHKANVHRFLKCQHGDGLAYPVRGGGACPDFNFASVAAWLLLDKNLGDETKSRLTDALQQQTDAILKFSSHSHIPVAESFRSGPLGRFQRLGLEFAASEWVSPAFFRQHQLGEPSWFSMLMRLMTLEIAGRTILVGPSHFRGRANLARGVGFNHLSTISLLLSVD